MKPKTKVEKEISRLSGSLRRLSQAQYDWAIKNAVKHFAWVNPTETRCYCTHCGKRIPMEIIHADVSEAIISCPSCDKEIKKSHQSHGIKECFYFVVLTIHKGWQVNRYYEVRMDWAVKSGAKYFIREVMRKWYRPHQKEITQSVSLNLMSYSCRSPYSLWSRMSIKKGEWGNTGYYTEWMYLKVYPRWKTLPVYHKCGFDGKPFDNDVQQTFGVIFANPFLEKLFKEGKHQEIRDIPPDARKHITDMYPSIRIALRHKYDIKAVGWQNYIDYLLMLKKLKKDLHSPHWICPQDWHGMHDKVLHMMQKQREKEQQRQRELYQLAEARRQAREEAEAIKRKQEDEKIRAAYPTLKGFFFGIHIQDKGLSIEPLKSVEEFAEEGIAMHHCVYSMGYYKKPLSLILSARDGNGERLETIEVSLSEFKVNQCYGKHNQPTDRHEEILNAVANNMWQIRDICQRKDWKQSIRQQGIAVNF